jgi:TetR/AcrR family transcriptional regulator, transcriptional repressor for nem operon
LRLTKKRAEHNRRTIVATASRMFRLHGMENVAVVDVMKESGFTHGGFYNHFESKEDLATQAVAHAFDYAARDLAEQLASGSDPQKALTSVIAKYLSAAHRDTCTGGCPASSFPVDAARNGKEVQAAFAAGIESYLDIFCLHMAGDKREARQRSVALLSQLVGALLLSRAVKKGQPELSEELLDSGRKQISKEISR